MAGSYNHAVTDTGDFRDNESFIDMVENQGDAYEMAEEMYGMIWYLARRSLNPCEAVEKARLGYKVGLEFASRTKKERRSDA